VRAAREAGRRPIEGFRLAGSKLGDDGFHDVDAAALARRIDALGRGPA